MELSSKAIWGVVWLVFILILLIWGWAHGSGFSLILVPLSCTIQTIPEGVCGCVGVGARARACAHLPSACMPVQEGSGGGGGWGTRQEIPGVIFVTCLHPPAWQSYSGLSASGGWWGQVVRPQLFWRVGTCAMYSAWRSHSLFYPLQEFKSLKTVLTLCGFTFSLCDQSGNW